MVVAENSVLNRATRSIGLLLAAIAIAMLTTTNTNPTTFYSPTFRNFVSEI